ncbi:MAG: lytic transglycosylase domain-containing protein [Paludibacteraceae bacterium]|nr:lytic transglycosylase domain-containing protein [Paludibacteraceae bacterium]
MRSFLLIIVALVNAGVVAGCASGENDDANKYCADTNITLKRMAFVPEVPESMVFAGQKIEFDTEDMIERFDRELLSFSSSEQTSILILKKAPRLLGEMRKILKEEGVPADMVYIAVIESNLLQTARSGVGAAGYWQFMEGTAKEFGLTVTETVDERYDVEKATRAACRYMKSAYSKFGDWIAVAASYNAGMGRINGHFTKQEVNSVFDLWMNNETSRYIFRMLAAKILVETPEKLGFNVPKDRVYKEIPYRVIEVNASIADLYSWAKAQGVTYRQLKSMNLWLRSTRLDNRNGLRYEIRLPAKK